MKELEKAIKFVEERIAEHVEDKDSTEMCRWVSMKYYLMDISQSLENNEPESLFSC